MEKGVTEHVYKGNKILEYPDGTFLATAFYHLGGMTSEAFDSLEKAQKWLDDNGYSIEE